MGWNIPGMNQQHRRRPGNDPGYGFAPRGNTCNQQNQGEGGGAGGFWTGLATGGVLGYMMGGNRGRT